MSQSSRIETADRQPFDWSAGSVGNAWSAEGMPIHYAVHGRDRPTVVLIHGWCCRQDFWRLQIAPLVAQFRVVTLDLPGHGASPADADARAWSIEAYADDVVAVTDAVGAETVALVGHSMGGAVAIEAAARLGARCRLILGVDTFSDAAFYAARPSDEIAARLRPFERDFSGAMRAMVGRITAGEADPAVVAGIAAAMAGSDAELALAVLAALLAWDIAAHWPLPGCPVETINSAALARGTEPMALDGLVVHAMDHVGHFPMLEDPAGFNMVALSILRRHLLV